MLDVTNGIMRDIILNKKKTKQKTKQKEASVYDVHFRSMTIIDEHFFFFPFWEKEIKYL